MLKKTNEEKWKLICEIEKEGEKVVEKKDDAAFIIFQMEEAKLSEIKKLLKTIKSKDEEWMTKFIKDFNGIGVLLKVIERNLEIQDNKEEEEVTIDETVVEVGEETKSKALIKDVSTLKKEDSVLAELMSLLRVFMQNRVAMEDVLKQNTLKDLLSSVLDSYNINVITNVIVIASNIANISEEGFWLALDIFNSYKLLKRESIRFETLVYFIKHLNVSVFEEQCLIISILGFLNSLLTTIKDTKTIKILKDEYYNLHLFEVIEEISKKKGLYDNLFNIIGDLKEKLNFGEKIDESSDEEEEDDTENPVYIIKLIRLQLSGTDGFNYFLNVLQYFLLIASKSNQDE
jgi:hypothetical protein